MVMVEYLPLSEQYYAAIIALGNRVHGDNYLEPDSLAAIGKASWNNDINASYVALVGREEIPSEERYPDQQVADRYLVGFRLTLAAQNWTIDKWCSTDKWPHSRDRVCYFKCNTVDEVMRGQGVGSALLQHSIQSAKQQGALGGLAHIWLASPGNSAFRYFSANGAELIAEHPNKWQHLCIEDNYQCPVCNDLCECTAAEMMLTFN
ncbi:MAG: GNAT family N-acetyltransferase [Alteromonas sp.]